MHTQMSFFSPQPSPQPMGVKGPHVPIVISSPPGHMPGQELRVEASSTGTKVEAAAGAWRAASSFSHPLSAGGLTVATAVSPWYADLSLLFPVLGASVGLVVLGAWCAATGDGPDRRHRMKGRQLVPQVEDDDEDLLMTKKSTKATKKSTKRGTTTKEKSEVSATKAEKKKGKATNSKTFMGFPVERA